MKALLRTVSLLAMTAAGASGCDAKLDATAACNPDPVSAGIANALRLDDAGAPRPEIIPTVETYATCAAMQDDLRADWRRQSLRRHGDYQTPPPYGKTVVPGTLPACVNRTTQNSSAQPVTAQAKSGAEMPEDAATAAPVAAGDAAGGAANGTFTNTQEKGVDEADTVKIGNHHIYVQRAAEIQVVARDTLALIGVLPLAGIDQATLYADGDTLVIVGQGHDQAMGRGGAQTTKVQILAAAAGALPKVVKEHQFAGNARDSRYVGGHLVLVFQDVLPWTTYSEEPTAAPIDLAGDSVGGIPCDRIIKASVHDDDSRFVKLVSLDARSPEAAPQFVAAIGGGDQIYMTESTLYLTKSGASWGAFGPAATEPLLVTKVAFDAATGAVTPVAAGVIQGRVKDQWAFNEYAIDGGEKALAVATSTGSLLAHGTNVAQNHLWVLRQNQTTLETAAAVHDFGTGEDIRSVRYVSGMAYVVTFKKTDPLFAFDMHNPLEPKLLGELQVPGFSVYMHPVAAGIMLGVGFDAADQGSFAWYQGLQVSLFDVSNPLDLRRLDNKIIGQRGSYSDVTGDHHAFYFDPEQKIVGIPVVELTGKGADRGPAYGSELAFSGAIIYGVGTTTLTESARLSHSDLLPEACKSQLARGHWWQDKTVSYDINRLYTVDGKLLTVSRFGLKTYDFAHLDQPATATVAFPIEGAESLCPQLDQGKFKL